MSCSTPNTYFYICCEVFTSTASSVQLDQDAGSNSRCLRKDALTSVGTVSEVRVKTSPLASSPLLTTVSTTARDAPQYQQVSRMCFLTAFAVDILLLLAVPHPSDPVPLEELSSGKTEHFSTQTGRPCCA